MPDKVTIKEFAKKVKEKYPEYKDVDDTELTKKLIEKYPEYKDKVDFQLEVSGQGSQNTSVTSPEPLEPSQTVKGYVDEKESARLAEEMNPSIGDIEKDKNGLSGRLNSYLKTYKEVQGTPEVKNLLKAIEARPEDGLGEGVDSNLAIDLYKSVNNGVNYLVSGVTKIPALAYNTAAIPQNMLANFTGKDWLRADNVSTQNIVSDFLDGTIDAHRKEMADKYNQSVTDAFSKGDISGGIKTLAIQVAESLPIMAAIGLTGGSVASNMVIGGSLSANKLGELEDSEVSDVLKLTNAYITGFSELAFERVGTGTIINTARDILQKSGVEAAQDFAKKAFKGTYENVMKKYFLITAPVAEGLEEVATQFTQNLTDRLTGVSPDNDLTEGLMDSFVVGAGAGFAISGPTKVTEYVLNKLNKEKINSLVKDNESIANMDTEGMSQKEVDVLSKAFHDNNEEANKLLEKEAESQSKLSDEEKSNIADKNNEIETLNGVIQQGGTPNALKEQLTEKVGKLEGEVDAILNENKLRENKASKTQEFFSDVVTGKSDKFKPSSPHVFESELSPSQSAFRRTYDKYKGDFDEHIATSIPLFRETQVKKGQAISEFLKGREGATMIDIGGSEGGLVKSIGETSGAKTVNLEPNPDMAESHKKSPVEGSEVISEAFHTGFDSVPAHKPTQKYDVVHESMVFQFITDERIQFINEVADNYLKQDGLFVTEEKLQTDEVDYKANESNKDANHKSKYYTPEQLTTKSEQVLTGMQQNQASIDNYTEALKKKFKHVGVYWSSGNFYGIVASNSKQSFDKYMSEVGDTSSSHSYVEQGEVGQGSVKRIPGEVRESKNIFKVLGQGQEAIKARKAQVRKELLEALGGKVNAGINPEAITKLVEYAVYEIADGTITTAKALHEVLKGFNVNEKQSSEIFNRANDISKDYLKTSPDSKNIQSGKGSALVESQKRAKEKPSKKITKKTIKNLTDGKMEGKITSSEKTLFYKQLRDTNRGIKIGRKQLKDARVEIKAKLKEMADRGLFKGDVSGRIARRLATIVNNANTPEKIDVALDMIERTAKDIEYFKKTRLAKVRASQLVKMAGSATYAKQIPIQQAMRALVDLSKSITKVPDIDLHLDILNSFNKDGTMTKSVQDVLEYVEKVRESQELEDTKRILQHVSDLMEDMGITGNPEDFVNLLLEFKPDSTVDTETASEQEGPTKAQEYLSKMVDKQRVLLGDSFGSLDGLSKYEADVYDALLNTDTKDMSVADLKKLNMHISNAIINGDFITGTTEVRARYFAKQNVKGWLDKWGSKLSIVWNATSQKWFNKGKPVIAMNKLKGDTRQIMKSISPIKAMGESLHRMVLGDFVSSFSSAKIHSNRVIQALHNFYLKNKMKAKDSFSVGTALFLNNFETDLGWSGPQESFEVKREMLRESVKQLESYIKKEDNNISIFERRTYTNELKNMKLGLALADKFETYDDFYENALDGRQKKLHDLIRASWENITPEMKLHFQKLGIKFSDIVNYSPISYNKISLQETHKDADLLMDNYQNPRALDTPTESIAARKNVRELPTRDKDGNKVLMYISLDAITNFSREFTTRLVDARTLDARVEAKHYLRDAELKDALDKQQGLGPDESSGISNHSVIDWKTKLQIRDVMGISGFQKEYTHGLDRLTTTLSNYFFKGAVGSFTQLGTQTLSNIPAIMAHTSVRSWANSASILFNTKQRADLLGLMKSSKASALVRMDQIGEQRLQNAVGDIKAESNNKVKQGLERLEAQVDGIIYSGLKSGDNVNTMNAWLAAYIDNLVTQKVIKNAGGFDAKMLAEHVKNPNMAARDHADFVASAINATMDSSSRAEVTKNRSSASVALGSIFGMPLKSFATSQNIEARIALRSLLAGYDVGRNSAILAGYVANVGLIGFGIRYLWGWMFQNAGAMLSSIILGDDEKDKSEERKLKELNMTKEEFKDIKTRRKLNTMMGQVVGSVAFGTQPVIVESLAMGVIDFGYQFAMSHYYEQKGETSKDDISRRTAPNNFFFTSTDNPIGLGVADQYVQLVQNATKILTQGDLQDEKANRTRFMMQLVTIGTTFGFAGADIKRVTQQATFDIENTMKDGYYRMSKDYGIIKEAVNKYDIDPVRPFTDKILYLGKEGSVEEIRLKPDQVKELNNAIGRKMIEIATTIRLDPTDDSSPTVFGKTLKDFNKNKLPLDSINKYMKSLRSVAEKLVILEKYEGVKFSEDKFKQLELYYKTLGQESNVSE